MRLSLLSFSILTGLTCLLWLSIHIHQAKALGADSEVIFADSATCAEADKIECYRQLACPQGYGLAAVGQSYLCKRRNGTVAKIKPTCAKYKMRRDWEYKSGKCVRKTRFGKIKSTTANMSCPRALSFNRNTGYCEVAPFSIPSLVEGNKRAPFRPVYSRDAALRYPSCAAGHRRNAHARYGFICQKQVPKSGAYPKGWSYRVPETD